ncbi:unnamed protein product [Gadus morhua 'NCC']
MEHLQYLRNLHDANSMLRPYPSCCLPPCAIRTYRIPRVNSPWRSRSPSSLPPARRLHASPRRAIPGSFLTRRLEPPPDNTPRRLCTPKAPNFADTHPFVWNPIPTYLDTHDSTLSIYYLTTRLHHEGRQDLLLLARRPIRGHGATWLYPQIGPPPSRLSPCENQPQSTGAPCSVTLVGTTRAFHRSAGRLQTTVPIPVPARPAGSQP